MMQTWYDTSKETDKGKWTKLDKAMTCVKVSMSAVARTEYKYSLSLSKADLKKPHSAVRTLRECYGASIGVSGEQQKFLHLLQQENETQSITSWETRIRNQVAQYEYQDFADKLTRDQL